MRLIVQVRWGTMAGHKSIIAPGQVLRVGRSEQAGLTVPHDELMSPLHFELTWDGSNCWLRDSRSTLGTLLDGLPVTGGEKRVSNGAWVRAGRTDFSVYFEGASPFKESEKPDATKLAQKAQALEILRAQEAPLFAVLDAAQDPRILVLLRESVEECRSLYEGPQGDSLEEVAPYLVILPKGTRLLEALVREGWGKSWGIYLACSRPPLEVRRHLRRFLLVEAENTEGRLYFRYYDPRVLENFLSSCSREQAQHFLGHIDTITLESNNGSPTTIKPGKKASVR